MTTRDRQQPPRLRPLDELLPPVGFDREPGMRDLASSILNAPAPARDLVGDFVVICGDDRLRGSSIVTAGDASCDR